MRVSGVIHELFNLDSMSQRSKYWIFSVLLLCLVLTVSVHVAMASDGLTWVTGTPLPVPTADAGVVACNGYIYRIGGAVGGNPTASVYYAAVNADGSVGTWQSTTAYPRSTHAMPAVCYNGHIYVISGHHTGWYHSDVYYADLNPDGSILSWIATTSYPTGSNRHSAVAHNGYIYSVGGNNDNCYNPALNTVYAAPINPDGSLGSWTATTPLPTDRESAALVVYSGYLYSIGGLYYTASSLGCGYTVDDRVYYAPITGGGTVGSWAQTQNLPKPICHHVVQVSTQGKIYVVGGSDYQGTAFDSVYSAQINAGGSLGPWCAETVYPIACQDAGSALYNDIIHVAGGYSPSSGYLDDVYYASLAPTFTPSVSSCLAATAVSSSQINLRWRDNSNNETGFKIEHKAQGGSYSQIDTVGANVTSYSDTGLNSGTYCYRVRTYNAGGDSSYSNEHCDTTATSSAFEKMYVMNRGNNRLGSANLNGTGGVDHGTCSGMINVPIGMAIDVNARKLYIVNAGTTGSGDDTVIRMNLDGTGCENLGNLNGTLYDPTGIALDVAAGKMYVTNSTNDTISRANLDGTGGESLGNLSGTLDEPHGIALDLVAGKMYVASHDGWTVSRANLDGTGGENLGNLCGTLADPKGIALDVVAGKMYVLNWRTNAVSRANLDGTCCENLSNLNCTLNEPYGLALDLTACKMYVVNYGNSTVSRANLDGTGGQSLGNLNGTLDGPGGIVLGPSYTPAPKIDVQRPAGTSIADGGTDNVGNQTVGTVNLTYTIDNTAGTAQLNVTAVTASNYVNSSGFAVVTALPLNVAAGGTATLDVRFNVNAAGAFSFDMDIVNNDSNENPYDIAIQGTGPSCVTTFKNYDPQVHGFAFANYPYEVLVSLIPWMPGFWVPFGETAGHCLGMAATSIALWEENKALPNPCVEDPPDYFCNCRDVRPPPWNTVLGIPWLGFAPCETRVLIEYNQILFFLDAMLTARLAQVIDELIDLIPFLPAKAQHVTEQIHSFHEAITTTQEPQVLVIAAGAGQAHALVGYTMCYDSDDLVTAQHVQIWVYDPNKPHGSGCTNGQCLLEFERGADGRFHMEPYKEFHDADIFTVYEPPLPAFTEAPWFMISFSPVDLILTDPDGLTLTKQSSQIPNAWYLEADFDGDGEPDDLLLLQDRELGIYTLNVTPEPGARGSDTFSLVLCLGSECLLIAKDLRISDIPVGGYRILSTSAGLELLPPKGDVNGDGVIDVLDVRLCLQIATGFLEGTVEQRIAADVDGDGQVTRADAEALAGWIIGIGN